MITKLFPGALGVGTFYKNCREQGVNITQQEAVELREEWINTFTEMKEHMKPQRWYASKDINSQLGFKSEQDTEEEPDDDDNRDRYQCTLICGQKRVNCSYNAACNTQFQGLAAVGAKIAGWNLIKHGYSGRVVNFVHGPLTLFL